jgi:hypothetical protein
MYLLFSTCDFFKIGTCSGLIQAKLETDLLIKEKKKGIAIFLIKTSKVGNKTA